MKKAYLALAALLVCLAVPAQAQRLEMPQPSPAASVMRTVGQTAVTIQYSSPGVKGRTIWGDLVPYDKVWRTGANKATQFTLSHPVMIGGKKVEAGTYALFTTPGKDSWKVMLNSNTEQWGAGSYDAKLDVVSFDVKPEALEEPVERLAFHVHHVNDSTGIVSLQWEKLEIAFEFSTMYSDNMVGNMTAYLQGLGAAWYDMAQVANMHVDNGMSLDAAQTVALRSLAMQDHFYNNYVMSKVLAAQGDYLAAYMHAAKAKKMGDENPSNFYNVYKDQIAEAHKKYMEKGKFSEKDYQKYASKVKKAQEELEEAKKG